MGVNDQPRFHALSAMGNQHALVLPPSSRVVAYVRAGAAGGEYPQEIAKDLVPTLAAGLAKCRAGYGDVVVVLRGHAENITGETDFANLKAGTTIIGEGGPTAGPASVAPTFTWTNTAGKWTIDQADVTITGLSLILNGVDAVSEAIEVTAGNFVFEGNIVLLGTAAAQVDTAITINAGADGVVIRHNEFTGTGSTATTGPAVDILSAVASVRIYGNTFMAAMPTTTGFISVGVAATYIYIADNDMYNTVAAGTACISVADAASDGIIARNMIAVLNDATPASGQGIVFTGTGSTLKCFENYSADQPRLSGLLTPAAVT